MPLEKRIITLAKATHYSKGKAPKGLVLSQDLLDQLYRERSALVKYPEDNTPTTLFGLEVSIYCGSVTNKIAVY